MEKPLMPDGATPMFWIAVAGCFVFWLLAYVLIIRIGFKEKTFGMPIAALCANFIWEILFSHVYAPSFSLIQWGNTAWALFDVAILITVWKYGRADFGDPWVKKHFHLIVVIGLAVAFAVMYPFAGYYKDLKGYYLGWAAALMMSVLFIAMLRRRGSVKGQSFYIALFMFLGNYSAYLWVKYFPNLSFSLGINLQMFLCTGFFNVAYMVMIYRKCREEGINPWKRFW
ncbi:MAG: hypothetical protein H7A52_12440 [Akkermansiaceae bacterium]|nr:hypothetical protein [Akkermansiaceae bacterium]